MNACDGVHCTPFHNILARSHMIQLRSEDHLTGPCAYILQRFDSTLLLRRYHGVGVSGGFDINPPSGFIALLTVTLTLSGCNLVGLVACAVVNDARCERAHA